MKAMPSTPTAVLAFLERRFPAEWSRTERHELTGAEGGPVQVEDFRARLAERAERIGPCARVCRAGSGDPARSAICTDSL